jgi:hypothetical protein
MTDNQQDDVTHSPETVRASREPSEDPPSSARSSPMTTLSPPARVSHADTPRPRAHRLGLSHGRTTTTGQTTKPLGKDGESTSSRTVNSADAKLSTFMSPNGDASTDRTTFPKRPFEDYQLSETQKNTSWRSRFPKPNTRSESNASRAESGVVMASSISQERLPDSLEPTRKVEEVSANSLAEERIASESESEEGGEYKDPNADTCGHYW